MTSLSLTVPFDLTSRSGRRRLRHVLDLLDLEDEDIGVEINTGETAVSCSLWTANEAEPPEPPEVEEPPAAPEIDLAPLVARAVAGEKIGDLAKEARIDGRRLVPHVLAERRRRDKEAAKVMPAPEPIEAPEPEEAPFEAAPAAAEPSPDPDFADLEWGRDDVEDRLDTLAPEPRRLRDRAGTMAGCTWTPERDLRLAELIITTGFGKACIAMDIAREEAKARWDVLLPTKGITEQRILMERLRRQVGK